MCRGDVGQGELGEESSSCTPRVEAVSNPLRFFTWMGRSMATNSNGDSKQRNYPELEERRSGSTTDAHGDLGVAQQDTYTAEMGISKRPTGVPDIYLIERAAIQLRRLRWEAVKEAQSGDKGEALDSRSLPTDAIRDLLKQYARPTGGDSSESKSMTRIRKIGMRVREILGIDRKPSL